MPRRRDVRMIKTGKIDFVSENIDSLEHENNQVQLILSAVPHQRTYLYIIQNLNEFTSLSMLPRTFRMQYRFLAYTFT